MSPFLKTFPILEKSGARCIDEAGSGILARKNKPINPSNEAKRTDASYEKKEPSVKNSMYNATSEPISVPTISEILMRTAKKRPLMSLGTKSSIQNLKEPLETLKRK